MNVGGVYFSSNNLPESNALINRRSTSKKEVQDDELKWLQTMYETYSRHLNYFESQLKLQPNPIKTKELNDLLSDCKDHLNEIQVKINKHLVK